MSCVLSGDAVAFLRKGSSSLWWSKPAGLYISCWVCALLRAEHSAWWRAPSASSAWCTGFSLPASSQLGGVGVQSLSLIPSRDNSLLLTPRGLLARIGDTWEGMSAGTAAEHSWDVVKLFLQSWLVIRVDLNSVTGFRVIWWPFWWE